jgi:hypothetical protein
MKGFFVLLGLLLLACAAHKDRVFAVAPDGTGGAEVFAIEANELNLGDWTITVLQSEIIATNQSGEKVRGTYELCSGGVATVWGGSSSSLANRRARAACNAE